MARAERDIDRVVQEVFFSGQQGGVLLEVGAAKPDYLSVSASFRAKGWTVVSVEPNPVFCAMHQAAGHDVLEYAASDEDRDDVDFFVVDSRHAEYLDGKVSFESFSSLGIEGKFAEDLSKVREKVELRQIQVKVRRLDTMLAEHHPKIAQVDVVAVDVEGWELSVMRGLDLERYRPRVVVLENLHRLPTYRAFMKQHGYWRWKRLKPNEVYVRRGALWGDLLLWWRGLWAG